jgi:SlyX protein
MNPTTEERITELEIRIAHLEAGLDELTRTSLAIEKLQEAQRVQIETLQQQLRQLSPSNVASASEEAPPPHY